MIALSGFSNLESFLPELFGDVCPRSIGGVTIHALVGGRTAQRTTGFAPRAEFHVGGGVEGVESIGQFRATTVPAGAQMGMRFAEEREEMEHAARIVVAAHQPYARDLPLIRVDQRLQSLRRKRFAHVRLQKLTVAARAADRTQREVDCKRYFVGELLKNNIVVNVFQHKMSVDF